MKQLIAFSVLASVLAVPVVAAPGGKEGGPGAEGKHMKDKAREQVRHQHEDDEEDDDDEVKGKKDKTRDKIRVRDREHDDDEDDDVKGIKDKTKTGDKIRDRDREHDHDDDEDDDDVSGPKVKAKPLPPGLQKKVERGGELPPGWQKKLQKGEVLDEAVYARRKVLRPVNKHGNELIQVEDQIIKVNQKTREIRKVQDAIKAVGE